MMNRGLLRNTNVIKYDKGTERVTLLKTWEVVEVVLRPGFAMHVLTGDEKAGAC